MKLSLSLAVALGSSFLCKETVADRFVCRVDRLRVMRTKGDPGGTEEWRINKANIYFGQGTRSKKPTMQDASFSLKNYNGGDCDPRDNKSDNDDGFYGCHFLYDGSRSGANWCVDTDEDEFAFGMDFRVGDHDAGFDNGPRFNIGRNAIKNSMSDMPTNNGAEWETYFTREGPDGRKARIYAKCWRETGNCDEIGYVFDGNGKGFSKDKGRGYEQSCSVFDPCMNGLSCAPGHHECYSSPRQLFEPCSLGFPCDDGLSCEPHQQRCYHDKRLPFEPCSTVVGYGGTDCADGLECRSDLGDEMQWSAVKEGLKAIAYWNSKLGIDLLGEVSKPIEYLSNSVQALRVAMLVVEELTATCLPPSDAPVHGVSNDIQYDCNGVFACDFVAIIG